MHSENRLNDQSSSKLSFIEQARRAQIIEAAIEVLASMGYARASFAQIAKQAGISTSLIPYHFKNKDELTREVYRTIKTNRDNTVRQQVAQGDSAARKLEIAIEADLAYMGTRPHQFQALIEILFGARNSLRGLEHMGADDDHGAITIENILVEGQKNGEFGDFNARHVALIIDGARDTFLAQLPMRPDENLETFSTSLIKMAHAVTRRNK